MIAGLQLSASGFVLVVSMAVALRIQSALGATWPPSSAELAFGTIASMNVLMSLLLVFSIKALR